LDALPVHSVQDVLKYVLGVDVRRRGPHGVQGDVSIRGGSFDQALILVDGFKVSDPQTGHHDLDLPLNVSDIERIEVLRGPGSRVYGPGAFSGAINIITRSAGGTGASLGGAIGQNSFSKGEISVSFPALGIANRLSYGRSESAGYRPNTDFAIHNLAWHAAVPAGGERIQLTLGHTAKEFGANGFYSASFPEQWEATETTFAGVRSDFDLGGLLIEPQVYWRRHDDDFILDRSRPDWYRNRHTTDIFGTQIQSTFESGLGITAVGGEIGREEIESESLGDHGRSRGGVFVEHRLEAGPRLTLSGGAFAYHYSDWGWELWPGIDAGFRLGEQSALFASVERSFRVPTYTELYYDSPANVGNPDLQPEEAWTYEGGMKWQAGPVEGTAALFRREGKNLIDWSRAGEDDPWQARNVGRMDTNGLEASVALLPRRVRESFPLSRVRASFAWLDADRATGELESKYVYNHLERQLILDLGHDWSFLGRQGGRLSEVLGRLTQSWMVRNETRVGQASYVLLDTRLAWRASARRPSLLSRLEFFVEGTNLFDTEYREAGSIPMPGRWIIGGVRIGFGE
jgi:iron complex outermembrane receptor protein